MATEQQFPAHWIHVEVHAFEHGQAAWCVFEGWNLAEGVADLQKSGEASVHLLIHRWVIVGVIPVRSLAVVLWDADIRCPALACGVASHHVVAEPAGIGMGAVEVIVQ